ncbi:MAG: hypothetical protein IJS14_03650 [Lentisphaeria bacterium]|nr:hypothetical protein [Lentisphaeria bacterium]
MARFFRRHPRFRNFLLFLICVLAAFAMRTHNYNREAEAVAAAVRDRPAVKLNFLQKFLPVTHHNFMPYSIECAMMFGYIQDIAAGRTIPKSDPNLHGLEDIAPYRQMIMGLEWFLGWGYRIKSLFAPDPPPSPLEKKYQDNVYLAQWTAFQLRLWISLSSGFLFLLLIVLRCRTRLAFFGGMFHAVAISAIARSTGQDIIRGNFALPVISGFLLLLYSCYTRGKRWMYALLFLAAFTAFSTWDLCLGFFSALTLFELGRWLFGGRISVRRQKAWLVVACAVVLSSLIIPFNQTYQTIMSPLAVVLLPLLIFVLFAGPRICRRPGFWKRALLLILLGGGLWLFWNFAVKTPYYVSHYSHFSDLTAAKLKFNNVKPPDPDKLTYDARIMWTPAMHSTDWRILTTFFPSIGVLTGARFIFKTLNSIILYTPFSLGLFYFLLLLAPFFPVSAGMLKRDLPRSLFPIVFTVVFSVGFIYIVRYHEFLILFLALALPLLLDDLARSIRIGRKRSPEKWRQRLLKFSRAALAFCCGLLLLVEITVSLCGRRNYDGDVRLRETAGLIAWFRQENPKGKAVITDFGLGPMLKCYAGMGIALQPQFGLERIRRPTQQYLNLLYHGDERQLAEFCTSLHADFFIYNRGCIGPLHIYSDRYIAGAKKIRGTSPANLMCYRLDKLAWFHRIEPPPEYRFINGVYTVFRVIRPLDRIRAGKLCAAAAELYNVGRRTTALRMITAAFLLDPASETIRMQYFRMTGRVPVLGLNGIRS